MEKNEVLKMLNSWGADTLMRTLGIEYTDFGDDWVEAEMPVNGRVHQPLGLLHGGATAALAESVASAGSALFINREKQAALGIDLQATHLKSMRQGKVIARGTLLHKGRSIHLWEIDIRNENGDRVCHSKLTTLIVPRRKGPDEGGQ
ncbi:MAG: PaaI family thioesterase [Flavobacteriia bacterium]|nr:PaaI family thioesterase [Flavobacteriia bacterium]